MAGIDKGFYIEVSGDAELVYFDKDWDYQIDYPHLVNAQSEIIGNRTSHWALISDFTSWYVQTPTSERYCLKIIDWYYQQGLRCHAMVLENDPIVHWQFEQARKNHDKLSAQFFTDRREAINWVASKGYDINFVKIKQNPQWFNKPSPFFLSAQQALECDIDTFSETRFNRTASKT